MFTRCSPPCSTLQALACAKVIKGINHLSPAARRTGIKYLFPAIGLDEDTAQKISDQAILRRVALGDSSRSMLLRSFSKKPLSPIDAAAAASSDSPPIKQQLNLEGRERGDSVILEPPMSSYMSLSADDAPHGLAVSDAILRSLTRIMQEMDRQLGPRVSRR